MKIYLKEGIELSQFTVTCVVYRGGTSRGLFFHESSLPKSNHLRELIFLKGIGAEDASHVNGLGGRTSHTSKVVIIDRSTRPGIDVDYTFVQLGIGSDVIDYEGTCGNLMAAVGAFAVDEGLVRVSEKNEVVTVNVWSTNIGKRLAIQVPLEEGKAKVTGDYVMSGVKSPGAKFLVNIQQPGGGKTGMTLPLSEQATMETEGLQINYSFVDLVNPFVYVKAKDLSVERPKSFKTLAKDDFLLANLEQIREYTAVKSGLAPSLEQARNTFVALPKVSFVSEPVDYQTTSGEWIKKKDYDILACMTSVKKLHGTFAVSGLLNLAGACLLKGTIPNEVCAMESKKGEQIVRIGHPDGVVKIRVKKSESDEMIDYVGLERTARRIMAGELYVPVE